MLTTFPILVPFMAGAAVGVMTTLAALSVCHSLSTREARERDEQESHEG